MVQVWQNFRTAQFLNTKVAIAAAGGGQISALTRDYDTNLLTESNKIVPNGSGMVPAK
jgi:hypothetical protein